MALERRSALLTTSPQDVYECPAGLEASAHGINISNYTGASVNISVLFFDVFNQEQVSLFTGSLAANKTQAIPRPINMRPGDKIVASADTKLCSGYCDQCL
jgi:hypothetical protein